VLYFTTLFLNIMIRSSRAYSRKEKKPNHHIYDVEHLEGKMPTSIRQQSTNGDAASGCNKAGSGCAQAGDADARHLTGAA
jgi:hypothetical protein